MLLCHDRTLGITYPRELICLNNNDCEGAIIPGVVCRWFSNNTSIKKPTLFDPNLRTYGKVEHPSQVLYTPWRAPGAAPVASPCGVSGGIYEFLCSTILLNCCQSGYSLSYETTT